jgi:hypothetical protein
VRGTVDQRAEIVRITRDIQNMMESSGFNLDDIFGSLIVEEVEKQKLLKE